MLALGAAADDSIGSRIGQVVIENVNASGVGLTIGSIASKVCDAAT